MSKKDNNEKEQEEKPIEEISSKKEPIKKDSVKKQKKDTNKKEEDKMAEKYTLKELVEKYNDVEDIFLKLTNMGYYMQYLQEIETLNKNGIVEPSLTIKEFEEIIK